MLQGGPRSRALKESKPVTHPPSADNPSGKERACGDPPAGPRGGTNGASGVVCAAISLRFVAFWHAPDGAGWSEAQSACKGIGRRH